MKTTIPQRKMKITVDSVEQLLPQTQCGECGYAGCKPYATALANRETTPNLCPPGGVTTLQALGAHLQVDVTEYIAEMTAKTRPPSLAIIHEEACIGCTKCIQACPVDAIIGSAKQMHTVLADECTGCELCVAPCPVDCIEMLPLAKARYDTTRARQRHLARATRQTPQAEKPPTEKTKKLSYIEQAIARHQKKGSHESK